MASLIPLSNHLDSTDSILVLSNVMVWSVWMCFETSDAKGITHMVECCATYELLYVIKIQS